MDMMQAWHVILVAFQSLAEVFVVKDIQLIPLPPLFQAVNNRRN